MNAVQPTAEQIAVLVALAGYWRSDCGCVFVGYRPERLGFAGEWDVSTALGRPRHRDDPYVVDRSGHQTIDEAASSAAVALAEHRCLNLREVFDRGDAPDL